MEKNLMLIINPAAGRGAYKAGLGDALLTLDRGGYRTSLFFTAGPGDAAVFARERAGSFDAVACVGGDGTLSEVISGLMDLDERPPLGYIPMGTANDVATTLGLPKNDTAAAARRILEGEAHPFDVGVFGQEGYFAYIAAFGAFTEVSYATPQNQKKALGQLAYVLQGASSFMQQLGRVDSFQAKVEYDGGVFEGELLYGSMSNSTSVAGIVRLPEQMVCLGDGMSELVLVKNPGTLAGFGEIVDSVLSQRFDSENLLILHTTEARFLIDREEAWTRDGESGGSHSALTLGNRGAALRFIF